MNTHKDHRKRMREKFGQDGADAFETYRLLEMLLYSFITRADTNPTAHQVLEAFPGGKLFSADEEALLSVPGMGRASAGGLMISCQTVKRLICDNLGQSGLDSEFKLKMYLYLRFLGKPYESSYVLYLTQKNRVSGWKRLENYKGDVSALVSEIVQGAKAQGVQKAVVCHSHGDNTVKPSVEDIYITKYLTKSLTGPKVIFAGNYVASNTDCAQCILPSENGKTPQDITHDEE